MTASTRLYTIRVVCAKAGDDEGLFIDSVQVATSLIDLYAQGGMRSKCLYRSLPVPSPPTPSLALESSPCDSERGVSSHRTLSSFRRGGRWQGRRCISLCGRGWDAQDVDAAWHVDAKPNPVSIDVPHDGSERCAILRPWKVCAPSTPWPQAHTPATAEKTGSPAYTTCR